jgi:hypothetical protein
MVRCAPLRHSLTTPILAWSIAWSIACCLALGSLPAQGGEKWPFGVDADAGLMAVKRDLFNLGLIGAKAWDADRPEPSATRQSGRQEFSGGGDAGKDSGPRRLVIKAILGDGPAAKAGLKLGDVVVGVNRRSFANSKGSFEPLAKALINAEAKSGSIKLMVERGGQTTKVEVAIPVTGSAARKPETGGQRDKIIADAAAWLVKQQSDDGGFPPTLGGMNGRAVNTCLAGLAWIAGGSTLAAGDHKDALEKAKDFVVASLESKDTLGTRAGANWDQTNWTFAYAGIFLGELELASKTQSLVPVLQQIADTLTARQEASGGFAHGPGGPNALEYLELNILGGFVLSALSLAQQVGAKVDDKLVKGLNAYLEASGGGTGGVAYSTSPGQKGQGNVGRTAVAWLGDAGLGLRKKPWPKKMQKWLLQNIGEVMGGHASLMQHITLAGVAAKALGSKATKDYWHVMQRDLVLARCPDGSLQMRPWHESLLMGSNSDVSMGQVWSTASWTIVLGADGFKDRPGGLPGWCAKNVR